MGCGTRKQEGFLGVDLCDFKGVDYHFDMAKKWPIPNGVVDEIYCCHTLEHFDSKGRIHFVNEAHRVLKPKSKITLVVPHWSTCRAYGDPTHLWPPVSEFWFYYLSKDWRATEAPHTDRKHLAWGFDCDFEATWGYGGNPAINSRSDEFKNFAIQHYREAIYDIHATLTKR
jgi:hypothetical protein